MVNVVANDCGWHQVASFASFHSALGNACSSRQASNECRTRIGIFNPAANADRITIRVLNPGKHQDRTKHDIPWHATQDRGAFDWYRPSGGLDYLSRSEFEKMTDIRSSIPRETAMVRGSLNSFATGRTMRVIIAMLMGFSVTACNGLQSQQEKRMTDFQVTQRDFDAIAVVTFKQIDAKGQVGTIVAPPSLDPRAREALRHVHPIVAAAPGPANTLPAGYFLVHEFSVEHGEAHLDGQLGPVTGLMTEAHMRDCGTEYSIVFAIEGGDWVNHAYKAATCAESRHWTPADEASPPPR